MTSGIEIPAKTGETDEEARFREAVNRLTGQLLQTLDSAIQLRTAPSHVQRVRHMARGDLMDFALKAMHAASLNSQG